MPWVNNPVRPWMKAAKQSKKGTSAFQHMVDTRFYRTKPWAHARKRQLEAEPLCRHCYQQQRTTEATDVDHILPIKQGGDKLDPDNLQSLCKSCHTSKTRAEEKARRK